MAELIVVDCPFCEAKVKGEVIAANVVDDPDVHIPDYRICLARCPSCRYPLITRQDYQGPDSWDDDNWSHASRVWPMPDREAHKSVPPIVQISLDEAHRCRRAGAHTACAVMCGRALEGICVHFKMKNALAKGLLELQERGLIDERLLKWGEQLRKHRNIAAHASEEKISREDATDLLDFVTAIVEYIFVLTARFEAFMERKAPPTDKPSFAAGGATNRAEVPSVATEDA